MSSEIHEFARSLPKEGERETSRITGAPVSGVLFPDYSHYGTVPRDLASRVKEIVEKSVLSINNLSLLPHKAAGGGFIMRIATITQRGLDKLSIRV